MKKEFVITQYDETIQLGYQIGTLLKPNMVITLEGDLGAGKTTLTKGIGKGLKITNIINSPTFTIMKIYEGLLTLYHLDVYRLDNQSGDEDLEEYFYRGGVCVIEWAKRISDILPDDYLQITITALDENKRHVVMESEELEYIKIIESVKI